MPTPTLPLWKLKQQVCDIGHRIWQKGFCAGNEGNHSVKLSDDRYLCTPTGISKGFLSPDDLIICDAEGKQAEPNSKGRKPTSEIKVHLAIYKARPDVGAVIHSHPPHATAFAIAGIALPEGIHPEAEVFLGRVKTARYATPSTHDLPNSLLPLIDEHTNSLLMGNHGSVCFSTDLIDTYYKLEILDAYCRILLLVKQIGRVNLLKPEQMTELLQVKEQFGLKDPRLACSADGCVGEANDDFLATFDVRPQTMIAKRDGGGAQRAGSSTSPVNAAAGRAKTGPETGRLAGSMNDADLEQLVQMITDQIMIEAA